MLFLTHYASPLGPILLAADETGLTGLWFEGQKYFPSFLGVDYQGKRNARSGPKLLAGWTFISVEKTRAFCRPCIRRVPPSGRRCGTFF